MLRSLKNKASNVWQKRKASRTISNPELQASSSALVESEVDAEAVIVDYYNNNNSSSSSSNTTTTTNTVNPPPYQDHPYPLPPTSVPLTISTDPEHEQQPPRQPSYPLPPTSVPSTVSILSDDQHNQENPTTQEPVEEPPNPVPNPYATKYVPYTDANPLKNNMFVNSASIYGRVNPDIMGGFGDDDESIWLVDDEEEDEIDQGQQHDSQNPLTPTDSTSELALRPSNSSSSHNPETHLQQPGATPAPAPAPSAQPAFHYQRPSFLDNDDDLVSGSPPDTVTTPETISNEKGKSTLQRGYAPISSSILDLTDLGVEDVDTKSLDTRDHTELPNKRPRTTAATAGPSTSTNPYVNLFEQQDDAMTMAYLRQLKKLETDVADEFRYETIALRAAMSEAENFVWCTSGCGSGQIHESGSDQPIVTCLHCSHRSCFHHNVAWHETLSCDEYDQLLADPDNFRSHLELENEKWSEAQQAQLEADRAMAQDLLAEDQAEMRRREERARQEREQAQKAAQLARQIAARRKKEEAQSKETVSRTTKPCAGCGWAIEKNKGW
ncbi:hypothetical protein ACHAPY_005416 [Fusarium culmorum]